VGNLRHAAAGGFQAHQLGLQLGDAARQGIGVFLGLGPGGLQLTALLLDLAVPLADHLGRQQAAIRAQHPAGAEAQHDETQRTESQRQPAYNPLRLQAQAPSLAARVTDENNIHMQQPTPQN